MTIAEPELIEKSKAGDAESFAQLIRQYEDRIHNLAHKVCATAPAEAEDVSQETFVTAFKKLDQFHLDSQLGTWLYRIAANLCWMRLRKRRREPFVPILDLPPGAGTRGIPASVLTDNAGDPAKEARVKELGQAVAMALEALPSKDRLVVILRDIENLSAEEAAKTLSISVPAVKSRLHRARLFLRDKLKNLQPS